MVPVMRPRSARAALLAALLAQPLTARAQIWMSRGADGSLHFTNMPQQRGRDARVFISSRDTQRPAPPAVPGVPPRRSRCRQHRG